MTDILEAFRKQAKTNPEIIKSTLLRGSRGGSYQAFSASIKTEQRASSQIAGSQVLSCPSSSPTPSITWLSGYALDPRPDLVDDHRLWQAVLAEAYMMDERAGGKGTGKATRQTGTGKGSISKAFYGLLHGLRCGGARLRKQRLRNGSEFLRLIYKPLLGPGSWQEDKLLRDWLEPHKDQMRECFEKALETYELWEEMRAKEAAEKAMEGRAAGGMTVRTEAAVAVGQNQGQDARENEMAAPEPIQGSLFRPA